MQLTIDRDQFTTALAWVARAVPTQGLDPILNGVLIDAHATGQVRLSAYDRDTSATTTAHADVATAGRVLVSGVLLTTIAKLLPAKPATMCVEGTDLVLTCGAARFTLPTLPVQDYPTLPVLPPYLGEVNAADFAAAVRQVVPAACTDPSLMNVWGVLIEISRDEPLRLVATDRFRIARRCLAWQPTSDLPEGMPDTVSARVDARQLEGIARHMATTGGTIRLSTTPDGALLGLADGTQTATLATVAVDYPDYRHHLAVEHTRTATVPVAELTEAIKRAAVFSDRGVQILLAFTASELEISAGYHDTARGQETLPIQFDGDPTRMAFKPAYLLDALATTRAAHARLLLRAPHQAVAVDPLTATGQPDEDYRHVVMPVRLPDAAADPAA